MGNNVGIHVVPVAFTRGNICGQQCRHTCCFCCIHTRQHLWTTCRHTCCFCCIHTRQHLWATMSAYMLLMLHSHEATFVDNNVGIHVASVAFTRGNICGQQCRHTCCFCCIHTRQHLWATMSAYMLLLLHSHEATFVDNNVGIHVASVAFTRGNICGQQCRHTCVPLAFTRGNICGQQCRHTCCPFPCIHTKLATFVDQHLCRHTCCLLHSHEATFVDNCRHTCCSCCIHTRQHYVGIYLLSITMSAYMLLLLHSHEATFVGNNVGIHVAICCIHTRQHYVGINVIHTRQHINNVVHVAHVAFTRHTCCFYLLHSHEATLCRSSIFYLSITRQHVDNNVGIMLLLLHSHEATFVASAVGIHVFLLHSHEATFVCRHTCVPIASHNVGNYVGIHVASVAFTRGNICGQHLSAYMCSVAFTRGNICGQQCRHTCVPVAFTRGNICGQQCRHTCCLSVAFTRGNICGQQCRHTCCFCCIHTRQHLWTTMSAYMLLLLHSHEATFVGNNVGIHVAHVAFTRGNICGQQCRLHVASVAFTRGNICGQQCRHTCCFCCIHTRQHLWATMSAYMLLLLHSHEATFVDQQCRHTCCFCCIHTRQHLWTTMSAYMCSYCIHMRQHLWTTMSAYMLLFVGINVGIHVYLLLSSRQHLWATMSAYMCLPIAFTRGNICGPQCRHTCCYLLHSHEATFMDNICRHTCSHLAFTRGNIMWTTSVGIHVSIYCIHTRQHLSIINVGIHVASIAFTRGNIYGQHLSAYMLLLLHSHLCNICGQQCLSVYHLTFVGNMSIYTCCYLCITLSSCINICLSTCYLMSAFTRGNIMWTSIYHTCCYLLHSHEATFVSTSVGIHVFYLAFTRGNICINNVGIHVFCCIHTRQHLWTTSVGIHVAICCIHTRQHLWASMSAYMLLLLHSHEATLCGHQCRHTCIYLLHSHDQHLWATMYLSCIYHSHDQSSMSASYLHSH